MRKSSFFALLFTLGVFLCLNLPAAAIKYRAVPLPSPCNTPRAINNAGQVTGISDNSHAFRYTNGVVEDLGTLGGEWGRSEGLGINAAGQVVGFCSAGTLAYSTAFLYSGGVMQDLSSPGERDSQASAINAAGQVVGTASVPYGEDTWTGRPFLISGGVKQYLPSMGQPWMGGEATGINASGQVVGTAPESSNYPHAFLYSGGVMHDLGTLRDDNSGSSGANGINDAGQVVGWADGYSGVGSAFLYDGGVKYDLGSLGGGYGSIAYGINNAGQVVGDASPPDIGGTRHGFLYSGGVMRDLNGLVINLPPVQYVQTAKAINDQGWIVARVDGWWGEFIGWYLLVPVSDPSPVLMLLLND